MLLDSPWLVEQPIVIACFHDELSDGEAAFAILKYANEKGVGRPARLPLSKQYLAKTKEQFLLLLFLILILPLINPEQCAKKVVSDSLGLVDFAIRLINSVFNLPERQVVFSRNLKNRRTVKSILLVKKFWGLVEMTSGPVNASLSLPEWQAVKMIFYAPC